MKNKEKEICIKYSETERERLIKKGQKKSKSECVWEIKKLRDAPWRKRDRKRVCEKESV